MRKLWLFLSCFIPMASDITNIITKEYVCKHLNGLFSNSESHNHLCRIGKGGVTSIDHFHQKVLLGTCTGIRLVDSTPLRVCRNQWILIHKTFERIAKHSKCSTGWFFGFKLHLIINNKGRILKFIFTLENVDDREPLKQGKFLENIKDKLCIGKVYIGQALFENFFLSGIQLVIKAKNNMKNILISIPLLRKRALI